MTTPLLAMLLAAPLLGAAPQDERPAAVGLDPRLEVVVDPRVELLSLVFRLAGRPEYNQPQSASPYGREVDEVFGPFRDHAVVRLAQELSRRRGVSYDAVMSLAVHLDDVETLGERVPFDLPPEALERRWTTQDARAFVRELADFVEVTGFGEFAAEHEAFWGDAAARLEQAVAGAPVLPWLDRFFGKKPGVRSRAVVGLLNGPASYGVRVVLADGTEVISPILGAERWDAEGLPLFGTGFEELLAHEFCHSYTNPLVERHMEALRPSGEKLLAAKRVVMEEQAYGSVEALLSETLVRACVGRYVLETAGAEGLAPYLAAQHQRGFEWTRALVEELAAYEQERERFAQLDAFLPRLAERLAAWTDAFEERRARAPKLLSMTPTNGAGDVDPGLEELRFEFDRPMLGGSWSLVGSGHESPALGQPSYDAARRVLTVPVTLEPGRSYRLWLNGPRNHGFASEDRVPLEPVQVSFTTRGA